MMSLLVAVPGAWGDMLLGQLLSKDLGEAQVGFYQVLQLKLWALLIILVLAVVVHRLHQVQCKAATVPTVILIVTLQLGAVVAVDTE